MQRRTTDSRTHRRSHSAPSSPRSASERAPLARRLFSARGTAILETALTLPLLLIVSVGIFEFGRAYQTFQVLTNAAREGARVAVLPNTPTTAATTRVQTYLAMGHITDANKTKILVDQAVPIDIGGGQTATGSKVTLNYPFSFIVLQPVAQLILQGPSLGAPFTLTVSAEMRNESQ